jgi:hypothetical protein
MKASVCLGLALLAGLPACTTQDYYNMGQGWQQEQCLKLPPGDERLRCQKSNAKSYEKYQTEAEAAKKPAP